MAIDISKILPISASEFFRMNDNNSRYTPLGVHYDDFVDSQHGETETSGSIVDFAEKVPDEADFVVGFRNYTNKGRYIASGTALIPKR